MASGTTSLPVRSTFGQTMRTDSWGTGVRPLLRMVRSCRTRQGGRPYARGPLILAALVHGVHDRAREGDLSREALGPDHYIREAGSTMSITTTRFTNEKVPSRPDSRWRALSGSGRRVLAQRRDVL